MHLPRPCIGRPRYIPEMANLEAIAKQCWRGIGEGLSNDQRSCRVPTPRTMLKVIIAKSLGL